ncbi:MAG: hypothetical protein C0501_03735 [Isosphaera sp.]|nr:hypothetical protein [Isosphaera sp.]
MTRLPAAALAGGLLFCAAGPAAAQPAAPVSEQTKKINELIAKGWEKAGITVPAGQAGPTAKATDLEFMRRAFIDLIGRIPTPEEVIDFEADKTPNKRARLVHRLLNDKKYVPKDRFGKPLAAIAGLKMKNGLDYKDASAENFADLWTTWMLTRSNVNPKYRELFRDWLTNKFANDAPWDAVVRDLVGATGKISIKLNPTKMTDDVDVEGSGAGIVFVARHLGDPLIDAEAKKKGEREDLPHDGKYDGVPITSRVTKLFLGIQSHCVQCHNHPFNKEYVQSDFWGVNGFFRQTDRVGLVNTARKKKDATGPDTLEIAERPTWNTAGLNGTDLGRGMVRYERRDGQKGATVPTMIRDIAQFANGDRTSGKNLPAGEVPSTMKGQSRRQVLAQWVTEHDNFGRAFVNRMWGHLFGRGLNKEPTVDDFSSNNEVVHPELLDYLAGQFKTYGYDQKKLLEWICTSDAYQLSHVANKAYAGPKYDPFFARMPLKALSPEVMFDSLAVATRAETRRDKDAYARLKNDWTAKLTQNFGDDEGNEVTFNGTVVQALLMMNGREINGEVGSRKGGGVVEAVVKDNRGNALAIYDQLFLMTVSRHPTKEELARLEEVRAGKAWINLGAPPASTSSPGGGTQPPKKGANPPPKKDANPPKGPSGLVPVPGASSPDDVTFYQDVFWALLNSSEFMLNH